MQDIKCSNAATTTAVAGIRGDQASALTFNAKQYISVHSGMQRIEYSNYLK